MVGHTIDVNGVQLSGALQDRPVVLQMHAEDFPKAFLRDLGVIPQPAPPAQFSAAPVPLSSAQIVSSSDASPGTLYQPVARVFHVALVQLTCESVGSPRLDPTRVVSAGLVVRRVPRTGGVSQLGRSPEAAWPWMKNAKGQFGWMRSPAQWTPDDDPDPKQRPQLQSGQPALDRLLATQTSLTALTESTTPAFVAPPEVCAAAQRTLVYALIPTASSEAGTLQAPSVAAIDNGTLKAILPTFLKAGSHVFPLKNTLIDYRFMSDEYASGHGGTQFLPFSATLRLLHSFGALDGSSAAQPLMDRLNKLNVTLQDGTSQVAKPMGAFYQDAATKLIDFDPNADASAQVPQVRMPVSWDLLSSSDEGDILTLLSQLVQARGKAAAPPEGRYQDASRHYRVRMFFRIKSESDSCPPRLVWSNYSDPFRFAAWYESAGRPVAPVPLPDPFDPNVMKNAKPSSSFAVPPSLMKAMQGSSLSSLSGGSPPPSGGGINLMWICDFSIPLITICAFFVLNIFLVLLNIVFFWLPFIKICIPFPIPAPSAAGTED